VTAPRPTVRVRLTALYGGLFAGSAVLLMAVSYWLMEGHLERTLPAAQADEALSRLLTQYAIGLVGVTLVALALGWGLAGRALRPLKTMTATARRVSGDRLGEERIALEGPDDELRELADTMDAMLDRLSTAFDGQRRFIANASHELRSPLTVIRTEADVALADPSAGVRELRAMGEAVLETTDRTDALLESLMLLARSQRGLMRSEPLDLAAAARRAASTVVPEARAAGVDLRLDVAPTPVEGDRGLLERLAGNLLENGVRYNRRGGMVELTTGLDRGRAVLLWSTTGRGCPPRPWRGSPSRSSAAGGAGKVVARGWDCRSCARSPRRTQASCGSPRGRAGGCRSA